MGGIGTMAVVIRPNHLCTLRTVLFVLRTWRSSVQSRKGHPEILSEILGHGSNVRLSGMVSGVGWGVIAINIFRP